MLQKMNKKIQVLVVGIAVVAIIFGGLIAYQLLNRTQSSITVTYYSPQSIVSSGQTTTTEFVVIFQYNRGSSGSNSFLINEKDFYLSQNGKPLIGTFISSNISDPIRTANGFILTSGQKEAWEPTFIVQGNITSYQLSYNGISNVHIEQADTPCPYSESELGQMDSNQ
jgi:hypothetical protein